MSVDGPQPESTLTLVPKRANPQGSHCAEAALLLYGVSEIGDSNNVVH